MGTLQQFVAIAAGLVHPAVIGVHRQHVVSDCVDHALGYLAPRRSVKIDGRQVADSSREGGKQIPTLGNVKLGFLCGIGHATMIQIGTPSRKGRNRTQLPRRAYTDGAARSRGSSTNSSPRLLQ